MMTLVALAISVAFIYSVAIVFGLKGMDFSCMIAVCQCLFCSETRCAVGNFLSKLFLGSFSCPNK